MKHLKQSTLAALVLFTSFAASAGQEEKLPTLSLSSHSTAVLAGDVANVRLSSQHLTSDLTHGYNKVSNDVKNAVDVLKKGNNVTYNLENITSTIRNKKGEGSEQEFTWAVSAALEVKSSDLKNLGSLVSQLSPYMNVVNYETTLSNKEKEKLEAKLMQDVTASFKKKAFALAKSLGYSNYEIKDINYHFNVGDSINPRGPRLMRAEMAVASDAPALPLGEMSMVSASASINGSIVLVK